MKVLLLSVSVLIYFSLVSAESRSKFNDDLDSYEKQENFSLMARTIFRIRGTTPSVCANKCLKMGSTCGSFEFNKNHFSCYGRRIGGKAVTRLSKKNNRRHNRFYLTTDPRYDVYYKKQNNKVNVHEDRKPKLNRPVQTVESSEKTTTTTTQSTTTANSVTSTTEYVNSYKSKHITNRKSKKTERVTTTKLPKQSDTFVKTTKKWNKIVFPTVDSNQRMRETSEENKRISSTATLEEGCYEPVGIESGKIEDSAFSSSSDYSSVYSASKARLNNAYAWYPKRSSAADNMFLQVDFENPLYFGAIDIQGHKYWTSNYYVTFYKIEYKTKNQEEYTLFEDNFGISEIVGPSEANTPKRYTFDTPFLADSIRVIPLSWSDSGVGIRMELYTKTHCSE